MTGQGCVSACIWLCCRARPQGKTEVEGVWQPCLRSPGQPKVPGSCFPTRADGCHSHAVAQLRHEQGMVVWME